MNNIKIIATPNEIALSFEAFCELRPHLSNVDIFINQVIEQQKEGYQIIAIQEQNEIVACAGFRVITTLAWGKAIYIDDLITKAKSRSKGYAKQLLDHIVHIAKNHHCDQVHLDSGYARHSAHKVYLKYGFELNCHHFLLKLK